jgi:hydroxymethylpyrimidine kinase/phosphomethylpyrimidine kinase
VRVALTIAGSDSGGGAGLQADLRTFASFSVHGLSVVTAVTAQGTERVGAVFPQEPRAIAAQLDAVVSDFRVDAVKIGMLRPHAEPRGGRGPPRASRGGPRGDA